MTKSNTTRERRRSADLHKEWVQIARRFARKCKKNGKGWHDTLAIMELGDDEFDEEVLNPAFSLTVEDR